MIHKNISIIVAVAENHAIGKDNRLLWHLPDDLKRFKRLTTGHTLIMGRNTFHSLPGGPLPDRRHIVLTDRPCEKFEGCETARSVEEALALAGNRKECFVIGGGMVYARFLPLAGKLYLTRVHREFEGDTFFPQIDFSHWKAVYTETVEAGGKNEYAHTYTEYVRI
ncbi:MAG TPA: dihydrofolate reductase [Bacteroides sp.]|nr:dihydrofolate reductase [Bacteroides sp.]